MSKPSWAASTIVGVVVVMSPLLRDVRTEVSMADDLVRNATRIAHQAAPEDNLRIRGDLAKRNISIDDFSIKERCSLADFYAAIERNRKA